MFEKKEQYFIWCTNIFSIYKLHLVCWRGYGNLSTRSIAIPREAEGQAWYCDAKQLSVDKFPYTRKQLISLSNDLCHILKLFHKYKIPGIPFIWLKSMYKHGVTWSHRSGKESGRRLWSPLWRHQWHPFPFISHDHDVNREIRDYA